MKVFGFNTSFQQQWMKIIIIEKIVFALTEIFHQLIIKFLFYFKDGTLIRNGMSMGDRMLITGFGDQYPARVWIKWVAENIKKKISFPDKAHTKSIGILRTWGIAVVASAFKIQDMKKIRLI